MTNEEQPRPTVMVVDDDPAVCELLVEIFDEAGFATTRLGLGQPALIALMQAHFDVLIIDQWLPDMNGLQICEAARHQYGPTAVVLLVTADPRMERRVTAFNLGVDDVVGKPFHVDELLLLARVEANLRARQRTAA